MSAFESFGKDIETNYGQSLVNMDLSTLVPYPTAVQVPAEACENGNDVYDVEKLIELNKKKKHPTKDAHMYTVHVQWSGYEGMEEEFTNEPLENMLEDVPNMAQSFIKEQLGVEHTSLV